MQKFKLSRNFKVDEYEFILDTLNNNIIVTGGSGTGKTRLANKIGFKYSN